MTHSPWQWNRRRFLQAMPVSLLGSRLARGAATPSEDPAGPGRCLDNGLEPEQVSQRPYGDYVRQCLDVLIEYGTDRYGPVRAPILMSLLDVRTRTAPQEPLALDEAWRVARRERRSPGGNNLYFDQTTLLAMYEQSRRDDQSRYAHFADTYLDYALKHLVDDKGLFWWGWHRHWDAYQDKKSGHAGNHHEIHIQHAAWPALWRINPAAVQRAIEALWEWHVIDKRTGEIDRHDSGRRGCDFAMTGGELLRAFVFLYRQTGDSLWRNRARLVADYYWQHRHRKTHLIPNRPNAGQARFDGAHFDTSITGLYCRCLLDAHEFSQDTHFLEHAVAYLTAYAQFGFDSSEEHFWGSLRLDGTPVPGPRIVGGYAQYEPRGPIDLWQPYVAGYEHPLATAETYARAATATGDAVLTEAAQRWGRVLHNALPPAACQEASWYGPYARDWAPHGTYAGLYAQTITCYLYLAQLNDKAQAHLQTAQAVADEAIARLYYRGLFRGHHVKPYYESIDGVGDLLQALQQLDTLPNQKTKHEEQR